MATTVHEVEVRFIRDDRDEAVVAGRASFEGEDYEAFDDHQARERLLADGRLVIGPEMVTFGGTIAPLDRIDRVVVEVVAKSQPSE